MCPRAVVSLSGPLNGIQPSVSHLCNLSTFHIIREGSKQMGGHDNSSHMCRVKCLLGCQQEGSTSAAGH